MTIWVSDYKYMGIWCILDYKISRYCFQRYDRMMFQLVAFIFYVILSCTEKICASLTLCKQERLMVLELVSI